MASYYYSNTAQPTTLSGSISSGATSITIGGTTGFPTSFPYILALDYGGAAEELVTVTDASANTLTVTRGFGGTSAQSHSLGAAVRHVYNAQDATDFRTHEAASSGVHGVTGSLVGTSDTQTLTNKTLSGGALSGTFTGAPSFSGNVAFTGTPTFVGASFSGAVSVTGALTLGSSLASTLSAASSEFLGADVSGDTFDRYRAYADGSMEWGSGSAARDVFLQRESAGFLKLADTGMRSYQTATTGVTFATRVDGDTSSRWYVTADGHTYWGPGGTSNADTDLYRTATGGELRTSGKLTIDGNLTAANFQLVQDWTEPALASGYTQNTANGNPAYRVIKILGTTFVQWRGVFNATYSNGVAVNSGNILAANLPAAATPATWRTCPAACSASSTSALSVRMDAQTSGQFTLTQFSGITPPWVSLDGIMYPL